MDKLNLIQSSDRGGVPADAERGILSEAIRFWERRRIIYNLILAGIVAAWLILTWPHFREAMTLQSLLFLFVSGTLANVCYCAAYMIDIPMQHSLFQAAWRRWRWCLWLTGMFFAILLANYWIADEIYPYVHAGL